MREAVSVGGLFHFKLRVKCSPLAHRVISLRCGGIWSQSGIADIDRAAPIKLDS
jgi:hypothetical protein